MSERLCRSEVIRWMSTGAVMILGSMALAGCGDERECGGMATSTQIATMPLGEDKPRYVAYQPPRGEVVVFESWPGSEKIIVFTQDDPVQERGDFVYHALGIGGSEVTITCGPIAKGSER